MDNISDAIIGVGMMILISLIVGVCIILFTEPIDMSCLRSISAQYCVEHDCMVDYVGFDSFSIMKDRQVKQLYYTNEEIERCGG